MNRKLCIGLLLAFSSMAVAQPLYKWTEADGSITFSPNKPPSGVDFQVIDAVDGISPSSIVQRSSSEQESNVPSIEEFAPQIVASDEGNLQPVSVIRAHDADNPIAQRVSSSSVNTTQLSDGSTPGAAAFGSQAVQRTAASRSMIEKQNRCDSLRKRVVSLERRLKSHLTPEDMDNTIIHMARFQRNFDQNCLQ